jgi:hypothetical protein
MSPTNLNLNAADRTWFKLLFLIAALWNFAGAVPGLADPQAMFAREFGYALSDPVMTAVYRGAWGTALIYGFGFVLVAFNPARHTGIVLMGGVGKLLFALNLLYMLQQGWASAFAYVVVIGDFVFVAAFCIYFKRLWLLGIRPL